MEFKLWFINETVDLANAIQLFQYQPGDLVDVKDLQNRYRRLVMQHHPDRGGDEEIMKQVGNAKKILDGLTGRKIPNIRTPNMTPIKTYGSQFFSDKNNEARIKQDIKNELNNALSAIQNGNIEDAVAAVHRLVEPQGKLDQIQTNPTLKSSLQQWLQYQNQGFNDYLKVILQNALAMV